MRTILSKQLFALFMFAGLVACTNDEPVPPVPDENPGTENPGTDDPNDDPSLLPNVEWEIVEVTDTTISITMTPENVDEVKWLVVEAGDTTPDYDTVFAEGEAADAKATATYTATGLQPETEYCVAVAARASSDTKIFIQTATTLAGSAVVMPEVTVTLREGSATESSLSFFITSQEAEVLKWVCIEDGSREVTAEQVLNNGTEAEVNVESEVVVSDLKENTAYAIYAAATCDIEGFVPVLSEKLVVRTLEPQPVGYHLAEGTTAVATKNSSTLDNYYITFTDVVNGYVVYCDFYAVNGDYLPSGEYTLGEEFVAGALNSRYTSFQPTPTSQRMNFESGSITVEATPNEETREVQYSFNGRLNFTNGDFVTFSYSGMVEGIELPEPLPDNPNIPENATVFTPDPDTSMPKRNPTSVAGEYYMQFYDTNWNVLAIDLMLDPAICDDGKAPLPDGTYTMADGTIDAYSNIVLYNPYFSDSFTEAELVVSSDGEEYDITFLGTAGSGSSARVFYMHYVGKIKDMVVE